MNYQIMFATDNEEEELRGIFLDSNMDIAGEIQEHILIKSGDEIIGGGMLSQTGKEMFHLLVFAVKEGARSHGIGSFLLKELISTPWRYCQNSTEATEGCFIVTTVAKGVSSRFYKKNGFIECSFSELPPPFSEQCVDCPDLSACNPNAMRYKGGNS